MWVRANNVNPCVLHKHRLMPYLHRVCGKTIQQTWSQHLAFQIEQQSSKVRHDFLYTRRLSSNNKKKQMQIVFAYTRHV